jgi:hypothetical protein
MTITLVPSQGSIFHPLFLELTFSTLLSEDKIRKIDHRRKYFLFEFSSIVNIKMLQKSPPDQQAPTPGLIQTLEAEIRQCSSEMASLTMAAANLTARVEILTDHFVRALQAVQLHVRITEGHKNHFPGKIPQNFLEK